MSYLLFLEPFLGHSFVGNLQIRRYGESVQNMPSEALHVGYESCSFIETLSPGTQQVPDLGGWALPYSIVSATD